MSPLNDQLQSATHDILADHYVFYNVIGHGCCGTAKVNIAQHIPTEKLLAVKRLKLDVCQYDLSVIQEESIMARRMRCINILPVLSSFCIDQCLWTVMPYMAYGSCADVLHAGFPDGLPESAVSFVLQSTLNALSYLHDKNFIHRSVRASHILISHTGDVCLSGFRYGISMTGESHLQHTVCQYPEKYQSNMNIASPEMLAQDMAGYNTQTDIYSVGILACHLANGVLPFITKEPPEMLYMKSCSVTPVLLDASNIYAQEDISVTIGHKDNSSLSVYAEKSYSQQFHQVTQQCLLHDSKRRPHASHLLQHSFFKIKQSSTLCELLQPLKPIIDIKAFTEEEPSLDELSADLQNVNIEEFWS